MRICAQWLKGHILVDFLLDFALAKPWVLWKRRLYMCSSKLNHVMVNIGKRTNVADWMQWLPQLHIHEFRFITPTHVSSPLNRIDLLVRSDRFWARHMIPRSDLLRLQVLRCMNAPRSIIYRCVPRAGTSHQVELVKTPFQRLQLKVIFLLAWPPIGTHSSICFRAKLSQQKELCSLFLAL